MNNNNQEARRLLAAELPDIGTFDGATIEAALRAIEKALTKVQASPPVGGDVEAVAREAVKKLANTSMNLTLGEWGEISGAILAALDALSTQAAQVREQAANEILAIADDFHPCSENDIPVALDEMREALTALAERILRAALNPTCEDRG